MTLSELIRSMGLTSQPVDEIVATLNAKTIRKTDSTKVTYAVLADKFGSEVVAQFDAKLQQIGFEWARLTLAGAGIDFSNEQTQAVIDGFVAANIVDPATGAALKALGVWHVSPCEDAGLPPATEADVQAALDEIANEPPPTPDPAVMVSGVIRPESTFLTLAGHGQRFSFNSSTPVPLDAKQQAFVSAITDAVHAYFAE